jgi:hypothetical protein
MNRSAILWVITSFLLSATICKGQGNATVNAKIDAVKITVGDPVRYFLSGSVNVKEGRLQWPVVPDTFNSLEVIERGKIDTTKNGDILQLKQRLVISGYDSGSFKVPAMAFTFIPNNGAAQLLYTDSFLLSVNTIPVDTTKGFKPIKDIVLVRSGWLDYIWYIIGLVVFLGLAAFVIMYFIRNKKTPLPVMDRTPKETLQEHYLKKLDELDREQLWQKGRVKDYYSRLTEILRSYLEDRFRTPAMELTTDEILESARRHPEMKLYYDQLGNTLYTADLAKFAKAQPMEHEHVQAMDLTKNLIISTKPVNTETTAQQP